MKIKYEKRLKEERDQNAKLKGETGIMKKRFANLQNEIDVLKEEIKTKMSEIAKLNNVIKNLEKDIQGLKKEIQERDETIQDKVIIIQNTSETKNTDTHAYILTLTKIGTKQIYFCYLAALLIFLGSNMYSKTMIRN